MTIKCPSYCVVIPTHNRATQLQHVLDDVLAQDLQDFEVVVVNDGSSDDTAMLLEGWRDARVRVVEQVQSGPCAARNAGAAVAKGEWLVFLDDDDRVDHDWLRTLAMHSDNPVVGFTCCSAILQYEDGSKIISEPRALGPAYGDTSLQFLAGTFAVRRWIFEVAGGYDPEMSFGENYELGLRLMALCEQEGLQSVADARAPIRVAARKRSPDRANAEALFRASLHMLEKHVDVMAIDPGLRETTLSIAGVNAARLGHKADARRLLLTAAMVRPTRLRPWFRLLRTIAPGVGQPTGGHV